MSTDPAGPSALPDFAKDLLEAEDRRRESLESRGTSVITVSGTLVTLLLALGALVTKQKDFVLEGLARDLLTAAVVAFVVAALLAIATYAPQPTRVTDARVLSNELPEVWQWGEEHAAKRVTTTRLDQLATAQDANDLKAGLLLAAVLCQVAAVLLVAAAVIDIL